EQVVGIVAAGCVPGAEYQARIDATFTQRDGRCCERTTHAIEDMLPRRTTLRATWRRQLRRVR
ncbi:MAG TPA: hypothetical protein VGN18_14910, partial [Jatrophihabitans sp.]|uniref:hypothetical protein n=1 Tax=Jatrophihabitans sp. TaxID=1932789 RepID=UPI002E07BAE4|nr:hypothetical protein [Jatrophihabitans sp.]